uniref:Nucleolar protein 58-like n=1 Tax=Tanacetum cinerariifolium TaxID=118510 RepID=A0A6L2NV22_TANCI|nr:nucleolar protein 58-like [Tanacetum cinerariifolium]
MSIVGTSSTKQPPFKDKSMWSDQEKRIQKIDRLARSLLIQGLSNDIYSLIDSNKTAKDLWDALARHMLGSEYGEQDRKAAKCGYSKDNCELNFKFLNNLQPEWKQYATMMRQNKNLMDINIDALYNILKQNQGDVNDAMGSKKKTLVITFDPLALMAEKTKVSKSKEIAVVSLDSKGSEADDFSELKKITALLANAFNRRKFYSKPTNNNLRTSSSSQSANKKQEFLKTDNKRVKKKDDEKRETLANKDFENQNKDLQDKYDVLKSHTTTFEINNNELNEQMKELIEKNNDLLAQTKVLKDQLHVKHVVIDTHVKCHEKYANLEGERYEYMIRYSAYFDNDKQHRKQIADPQVLFDKTSVQMVELDKHVRDLKNKVLEKDFKISELEECVRNKDLEIEKCLERLNVCENKIHKMGQTNQTVHMIMPSKDNLYIGRKGIGFENLSYFEKEKDLRPTLYDEKEVLLKLNLPGHRYSIHPIKRSSQNRRIRRWRYNLTLAESKFKTPRARSSR